MTGVKNITQKKLSKSHRKEEEFNLERMTLSAQLENTADVNQKNVLRGKLADLEIRKKGYRERHNTLLSGGMELDT